MAGDGTEGVGGREELGDNGNREELVVGGGMSASKFKADLDRETETDTRREGISAAIGRSYDDEADLSSE